MEIEIIEVIWKQSKIYIPFNTKESIVYSKNGLVFGYKSKETLTLALSNANEIVDNGVSFDFDKLFLKRVSGEYEILFDFKNDVFSFNYGLMSLDSPIVILNKKSSSCFFEVSYRLQDEVIKFYIDYEVI